MLGPINPTKFYTHPKNPNILEVFKQIGRAEELGSGVRNVYKYGKIYGKVDPVFDEGDIFKTYISIPSKYILKADTGMFSATGKATSLSVANKNYKEVVYDAVNNAVNDAVIIRLKSELVDIILNKELLRTLLFLNPD